MIIQLRRMAFALYAILFRIPVWGLIWLIGRTGVIKTVFVIYPHDKREYARLCPDNPFFVKFLSGRPTPGGLILDGWKPIGIYLFISNTPQELVKKKNRDIAQAIVRRMQWVKRISGAQACGFAGQLGPILERRHGISMEAPFFTSTFGNLFSIDDAVNYLASKQGKSAWQTKVAIVGGGDLGNLLNEHLGSIGYQSQIVDLFFKRRGTAEFKDQKQAEMQLKKADFVINLLATGDDFLALGIGELLHEHTSIIDFSRPPINTAEIKNPVFMGNRVTRPNMRFAFALPEWGRNEIPACSIPCILASRFGYQARTTTDFCTAARNAQFATALAPRQVEDIAYPNGAIDLLKREVAIR